MTVEVIVKKWGNSLGVVLPKTLVEHQKLKENDKIFLNVVKETNIKQLFGSLKLHMSAQKLKNIARKGWD